MTPLPATSAGPVGPTPRTALRRNRGLLALVAVVLVVVGVVAWAGGPRGTGRLDPAAVDPSGSRALADVLAGQGVDVVRVETADDAAAALRRAGGGTLLITRPGLVDDAMAEAFDGAPLTQVVLVGAPTAADGPWARFSPGAVAAEQERAPGCALPVAARAGSATLGGATAQGAESCYDGTLVEFAASEGAWVPTAYLASGTPLTNDALADLGNASLATGLLGSTPTLVWWLPSPTDPRSAVAPPSLTDLLPPWVGWVAVQLLVLALVVAVVRGRRFGRVVTEPLPVTVRASETTEGLGRLYRRSDARGHAARALAGTARARLAETLGLPRGVDAETVVARVVQATGRPVADVRALLVDPDPPDDAALARYPSALDDLERQVRHP